MNHTPLLALDYVTGPYEHLFWKALIAPMVLVVVLALWNGAKNRFNWVDVLGILVPFGGGVFVLTLVGVNIYASYLPNEKALAAIEAQVEADKKKTAKTEQAAKAREEVAAELARKKAVFAAALSSFTSDEGKEIQDAIDDLGVLENGLKNRIQELQDFLEAAERKPGEDPNLAKLKADLEKVQASVAELKMSLNDAFFEYKAFKSATTSGERKALDEAIKKGTVHAARVKASFTDLKQQISGEKKPEPENQ